MVEHAAREGSSNGLESVVDEMHRQEKEHTATVEHLIYLAGISLWLVMLGNDLPSSRFVSRVYQPILYCRLVCLKDSNSHTQAMSSSSRTRQHTAAVRPGQQQESRTAAKLHIPGFSSKATVHAQQHPGAAMFSRQAYTRVNLTYSHYLPG